MRVWKYLLPAVAVVLVVAAAVAPRPAPATSYRRYVSPPLPDGVRYTFLYPSTLDKVSSHIMPPSYKGKYLQLVVISKKESRFLSVALWQNWFKPEAEFVSVLIEKPATRPLKSSRLEEHSATYGQGMHMAQIEHTVSVDDPRAHEHFRFWHASDFGTASFKQHDQVVTNSFRVLLPGDPVPAP